MEMVYPLTEGTFTVDDSKVFIPFDAAKDEIKDRPASLLVDIVPFLIQTKKELVVIDPGLGMVSANGEYNIYENIAGKGFKPEDASIVLLSHLHKDHASGICYGKEGAYNLMFPNARYYCQEQEMKAAFDSKDSPSYLLDKLDFLRHTSNLVYLNGDGSIDADIKYEVSGGHTQFHQVFIVQAGETTCFFGGDVLPQPKQLQMKFVAKYDYDGKEAAEKRIEYGKRAAAANWVLLFFHSAAMPMVRVTMDGEKFVLSRVE